MDPFVHNSLGRGKEKMFGFPPPVADLCLRLCFSHKQDPSNDQKSHRKKKFTQPELCLPFFFFFLKEGDQGDHNLFDDRHSAANLILSNRHFGNHFQSVSSSSPLLFLQITNCKQQQQQQQRSRVTVLHTHLTCHTHISGRSRSGSQISTLFLRCVLFLRAGDADEEDAAHHVFKVLLLFFLFSSTDKTRCPSQTHDGRRTQNTKKQKQKKLSPHMDDTRSRGCKHCAPLPASSSGYLGTVRRGERSREGGVPDYGCDVRAAPPTGDGTDGSP